MNNLVKNNSKAYNYNFAGLHDIAQQGYKIPKMKTESEYEREYVYYYDEDLKDWFRGAEIIIPEMKGSNKAQQYGAALSYARRYTTLMALSLATTDDDIIEDTDDEGNSKTQKKTSGIFDDLTIEKQKLVDEFYKILSSKQIDFIMKKHNITDGAELTVAQLKGYIDLQKSREKENEGNKANGN